MKAAQHSDRQQTEALSTGWLPVRVGEIVLLILLALLVVAVALMASVPPVSRDALIHHLALPKLYLQKGAISELPELRSSYYPMNLDMLYLIPLAFGNDIAPKFIHWAFGLATAGIIGVHLRSRLGRTWAIFGGLLFLSIPIVVRLSAIAYVDLGLIFFSTTALLSLLWWAEDRGRRRYLLVSAVACGLALGTKYNGLVCLALLTLFVPLLYVQQARRAHGFDRRPGGRLAMQWPALKHAVMFVVIALVLFSPWMTRNALWTGNPLYPLYDNWYVRLAGTAPRDASAPPAAEQVRPARGRAKGSYFVMRRLYFKENWLQIALIPLRVFYQGRDDDPKYFDGKLNPGLLLLSLLAFVGTSREPAARRTEKKILLAFTLLFLLVVFLRLDMRIRYIAPIISPLVILSVYGLHKIGGWRMRAAAPRLGAGRVLMLLAAAGLLAYNAAYAYERFRRVDPWAYLSGRIDRHAYIERFRPEYAAMRYANMHLPAGSRILGIFIGKRRYYSDHPMTCREDLLKEMLANADSPAGGRPDIAAGPVTHLLIRFDLFQSWVRREFDEEQKQRLRRFWRQQIRPLFAKNGYGLFEINRFAASQGSRR